jgi:predicted ATP-dependent protease
MYPIQGREWMGSEGNASLAGQTDTPLSCQFMIVAAMNYNAIPMLNKYPMLRDRFYYGNIKKSEDEILDTPQNRIKIAQFLADETYRFKVPPLCAEAVKLVINHMRRRASSATYLKLQMRAYIQDIKKGGQLVWAKKELSKQCPCGLVGEYQHAEHIYMAINQYALPLEMQILDDHILKHKPYRITEMKGSKIGVINGLVVMGDPTLGQATGDVAEVASWIRKLREDEPRGDGKWNFVLTGAPQDSKDTWISNSIMTVQTTINRLYSINLVKDYYVHIAFIQSDPKAMDGPSAGITMTLSLMSWLGDPRLPADKRTRVPMRLDTPVTGTVENLGMGEEWDDAQRGDVRVGPIGGVFEKAYGAMKLGAAGVIIPEENFNAAFFDDFVFSKLKVQHAGSVLGYFDLLRADKETNT